MLQVSACPHPFRMERANVAIPEGANVAQIVEMVQPDPVLRGGALVSIGGIYVPEEAWANVRPKQGHLVQVIITMHRGGGGGKNPLKTILSIAVMIASAGLATPLAVGLGIGGFTIGGALISGTMIAGGLITIAGNLLVGALVPTPKPRMGQLSGTAPAYATSQHYFVEAARNRERPWEKVPKLLGRHRIWADMGAKSYTEIEGDDQYLRALFIWGYGPIDLTDFRIGETPIEEFEGVEIEHRAGYEDDAPLTLFTNDVFEEALSVALTSAAGWQVRTTQPDIDEVSIDIAFPQGLVGFDDRGNRYSIYTQFEVQYAPAGTGDWSASLSGIDVAEFTLPAISVPPRQVRASPFGPASAAEYVAARQYVRVIINRYTGVSSLLYGSVPSVYDTSPPPVPSVPAWADLLATIYITSDTTTISAGDIVDNRTSTIPARENTDEFKVLPHAGRTLKVAAGRLYFNGIDISDSRPNEVRRSLRFPVPRGQYDVRIRRITADFNSDRIFDKSFWSRLRSIRNVDPVQFPYPVAKTAVRIKATGQLNNVIDAFNCLGTSILPVWNGDDWNDEAPTNNPASIAREVLQGSGTPTPQHDDMLNLPSFAAFFEECTDKGYAYNSMIDYRTSVGELLNEVTAAGRAFWHRPDGRYTIALEKPQDVIVQHFSPKNTWAFEGTIQFAQLPQGFRIRFANEAMGFRNDLRNVFIDGYDESNATRYQDFELPGVTDADLIWRHGRYNLAVAYNRREHYSFWSDFESLSCTRGDLCVLSHDIVKFGMASGRILSVQTSDTHATGVTIDEFIEIEEDADYAIRIHISPDISFLAPVTPVAPEEGEDDSLGVRVFEFVEPVLIADAPSAGDFYMFGLVGQESVEVLIKSVERGEDLAARIIAVAHAPVVYEADEGDVPAWSSSLPGAIQMTVPVVRSVRSDGSVLLRDPDGSLSNRILVTFRPLSQLFTGVRKVQARWRETGSDSVWNISEADVDQLDISLSPVEAGVSYDLEFRFVTDVGRVSSWTETIDHVVVGKEARPADVSNFTAQQNGAVCLFRWARIPDLDAAGYDIRYIEAGTSLSGDDLWANMLALKNTERGDELTSAALPPGNWMVGIKARDTSGNESLNVRLVNVRMVNAFDIIFSRQSNPRWAGIKTDCLVHDVSGYLVPEDNALAAGDNFDVFDRYRIDAPDSYSYEAEAFDIGFVYDNVRVWAEVETHLAPGQTGFVRTAHEISIALDDDIYGEFEPWTIGTASLKKVRHRIVADRTAGMGAIASFKPVVDVEERSEYGDVVVSASADVRVTYERPFALQPFLEITVDSDTPAFPKRSNADNEGFDVSVFDQSGNRIVRPVFFRSTGV